jgi:hypothetical protein
MNKYERAEIKGLILARLASLTEERPVKGVAKGAAPGAVLGRERLATALRRIDAENFGECFKCEEPISMDRLRLHPESMICGDCLEAPGV